MFETLRSLLGEDREYVRECRRCGTDVDGGATCPSCGASDVARYTIE